MLEAVGSIATLLAQVKTSYTEIQSSVLIQERHRNVIYTIYTHTNKTRTTELYTVITSPMEYFVVLFTY